jgi:hypothetical protein
VPIADPVLLPFRDIPPFGRLAGYAGPPNRKAAEVVTKYIITDMYAKAIQGMPAEAAGRTTRSSRSTRDLLQFRTARRAHRGLVRPLG